MGTSEGVSQSGWIRGYDPVRMEQAAGDGAEGGGRAGGGKRQRDIVFFADAAPNKKMRSWRSRRLAAVRQAHRRPAPSPPPSPPAPLPSRPPPAAAPPAAPAAATRPPAQPPPPARRVPRPAHPRSRHCQLTGSRGVCPAAEAAAAVCRKMRIGDELCGAYRDAPLAPAPTVRLRLIGAGGCL